MLVSTDDQARRLRYIYLGPRGWRFPFDARFPAIGLALLLAAVFSFAAYAFSPPGTRLGLLGALASPLPAILLTRQIMRHVDHDRPLRWWVSTIQSELTTPRPPPAHRASAVVTTPDRLFTEGPAHEPARQASTEATARRTRGGRRARR